MDFTQIDQRMEQSQVLDTELSQAEDELIEVQHQLEQEIKRKQAIIEATKQKTAQVREYLSKLKIASSVAKPILTIERLADIDILPAKSGISIKGLEEPPTVQVTFGGVFKKPMKTRHMEATLQQVDEAVGQDFKK